MATEDDGQGAVVLANQAQFNALISILIEKGVLTDADTLKMMDVAINSLSAGPVVQTASPSQLELARKLLEFSRSAMQHSAQEADWQHRTKPRQIP